MIIIMSVVMIIIAYILIPFKEEEKKNRMSGKVT